VCRENEVVGSGQRPNGRSVAEGTALNNAFAGQGNRRDAGIVSLAALFSARTAGGFGGDL
jgi:hypothetical protein